MRHAGRRERRQPIKGPAKLRRLAPGDTPERQPNIANGRDERVLIRTARIRGWPQNSSLVDDVGTLLQVISMCKKSLSIIRQK